ncbi:MAG: acyl-ACP--UDP-N-acetylglucosamine O-acyltransferase [Desulfobacterota bacterium]|nr:acyl-ACP--UDP-N-acetylglucosamine O-acyltransferase [Thermodesulfobacteriota bacterium]
MAIHPTAIIDPRAQIDTTAAIGPYVIIDGNVTIGSGTKIYAHAYITGATTIGNNNEIHMGAVIGHEPQDTTFDKRTTSFVRIGDNNIIREYCTIHRGTKPDTETVIGNGNFLMAGAHVAHNVVIGNNVIIANNALLAGHVKIGDRVFISGGVVIHQFVTVGRLAMLSGNGRFSMDIPPFVVALERNAVEGVNLVGLRRAGLSAQTIRELKNAYKILYLSGLQKNKAIAALEGAGFVSPEAREFIDFVRTAQRPLVQHISRAKAAIVAEEAGE